MWTQEVSKALESVAAGEKNAMRELRRKQVYEHLRYPLLVTISYELCTGCKSEKTIRPG